MRRWVNIVSDEEINANLFGMNVLFLVIGVVLGGNEYRAAGIHRNKVICGRILAAFIKCKIFCINRVSFLDIARIIFLFNGFNNLNAKFNVVVFYIFNSAII